VKKYKCKKYCITKHGICDDCVRICKNLPQTLVISARVFNLYSRLSVAKKYAEEIMSLKKLTKSQYLKLAEMIRRA
jgi:hypothetical protein